jgi:hypothetical protein
LINKKGAREAGWKRTESRGDNQQGDEKKGKIYTRESSTGKKEGSLA